MEIIKCIINNLEAVKEKSPLIHHITNYVTVNDCANIVLAIGGSPVMAKTPFLNPKGAISPPLKISAIEIAAPNHKVKNDKLLNFTSISFILNPPLL